MAYPASFLFAMWCRRVWLCLILAGVGTIGLAEEPYHPTPGDIFKESWRWTTLEALSPYVVREASKGPDGTVWFAVHGGVVAYDGYRAKPYWLGGPRQTEATASANEAYIALSILAASDGKVYILTPDFGACLNKGRWTQLFRDRMTGIFSYSSGSRISEAADGSVWFATPAGLFRVKHDQVKKVNLGSGSFCALTIDRQNDLWLADLKTDEILRYRLNAKTGQPVGAPDRFATQRNTKQGLVVQFCQGAHDRIWIATNSHVQALRYVEGDTITNVLKDWSQFGSGHYYLLERPDGSLWVVTRQLFAVYTHGSWTFHNMKDYATWFSFMYPLDENHLLLGGHTDRTYRFDASTRHWQTWVGLNFQCRDRQGRDWFLTANHRIVRHDPKTASWIVFDGADGVIGKPNRLTAARNGVVWASGSQGTRAAVAWFSRGAWHRRTFPAFSHTINPLSPYEARNGWMYFGAGLTDLPKRNLTGGLLRCRLQNGRLETDTIAPPACPWRIMQIAQSGDGELWLASNESLFRKRAGQPARMVERFRRDWIDSLSTASDGSVWVLAWRTGVSHLEGHHWIHYRLPENRKGDTLVSLLCDRRSPGVWVATSDGLNRFDGHSWSFQYWLPELNLSRGQCQLRESSNGSVWINSGAASWFNFAGLGQTPAPGTFKTVRHTPDTEPPDTWITGVQKSLSESSNAVMEWSGVDAWSGTPTADLQYSYRINDGPWSPYQKGAQTVLHALGPGDYRFEVRARDLDWNVDPTPAVTEFTVTPLLWKRPWFVALMAAVIGTIIVLLVRINRMRVRHLLAMEEFKIDFFTKMSHELRTPLSAIIGPVESMLKKTAAEPLRDSLVMVQRNSRRLLGMVNQLLEFRKVELGMLKYEPARSDLIVFLKDVVHAHVGLWKAKQQSLRLQTSAEHEICWFDPEKLQHIVSNLLSNAIKYTPEGGSLTISCDVLARDPRSDRVDPDRKRSGEGTPWLELVVEDDGVGIAPAHQELIFKPFYRERTHAHGLEGSGIGLAYTYDLVTLWGGEIRVQSPTVRNNGASRGTRFTVWLPLVQGKAAPAAPEPQGKFQTPAPMPPLPDEIEPPPEAAEPVGAGEMESPRPPEASEEAAEGSPPRSGAAAVLIVEDNADFREFLQGELSEQFRILTAENGRDALEKAKRCPPDLVVTDLMMPGMGGMELCTRLKTDEATSHIPVLMLTARGSDEFRIRGIEQGADEYYAKPVNIDLLKARIKNLLESRRLLRERFSRQILIQPSEITVTPLDEQFLRKAIAVVEEHMRDEDFDVESFSAKMGMGRASLYRKMEAVVGQSPFKFIRSIRLKRAVQLLESGNFNVSEAMEQIGINGLSHFGKIFRDEFGMSPSEYRNRALQKKGSAEIGH